MEQIPSPDQISDGACGETSFAEMNFHENRRIETDRNSQCEASNQNISGRAKSYRLMVIRCLNSFCQWMRGFVFGTLIRSCQVLLCSALAYFKLLRPTIDRVFCFLLHQHHHRRLSFCAEAWNSHEATTRRLQHSRNIPRARKPQHHHTRTRLSINNFAPHSARRTNRKWN